MSNSYQRIAQTLANTVVGYNKTLLFLKLVNILRRQEVWQ